jgi:HEAT repeat protein
MDTPTFPTVDSRKAPPLDQCIAELRAGTFAYAQLATFSDLPSDGARSVEQSWLKIPVEARRRLVGEAVELAEANVEYQFNRLCRIALNDPEAEIRQRAIAGLWEDETRSLIDALLPIAESDESADVRAGAIGSLGDALERLSDDGDDQALIDRIGRLVTAVAAAEREPTITRRRAVEALGSLSQTTDVRQLIRDAYEHGDQAIEAGALTAMGRSLDSRWRPVLRAVLRSEDAEIRFEAARSLGMVGNEDDVSGLAELVDDEDSDVRRIAILALGEIGGPGAVKVLRALAERDDDSVRELVQEALDNALIGSDPLRGTS